MQAFSSIGRGLRSLTRFSGRDTRGEFWPFAGFAYAVSSAGTGALVVPTMNAFFDTGTLSFEAFILGMALGILLTVALLAAAVTRRLHDRGRSGWWGALPLPFLAFGLFAFSRLLAGFARPEAPTYEFWFFPLFFNNLIYMAVVVLLVVLLARAGTGKTNRFGPAPGV